MDDQRPVPPPPERRAMMLQVRYSIDCGKIIIALSVVVFWRSLRILVRLR